MENDRISRKKTYAKLGRTSSGSGLRCSIHRVVGIELIRNEEPSPHQKEELYDTYDLRIIEEVNNGGEVVGYAKHEFTLFGKRGEKLYKGGDKR